jgi:uncharacterized membrane protein YGL010W
VLRKWRSRHRNRTNQALHLAGVPATLVAGGLILLQQWVLAVGFFVGGYVLQFIGHMVEGSRAGEEQVLRRAVEWLRRRRKDRPVRP